MFIMPKNVFLQCFYHPFLKTALETQIKANATFLNVQHAEKHVFALFSSSIFEICTRNANKGICRSRKCSTCRKNAFLQCFHHQFLKFAQETQIKAYAAVANVQHAEKRVFALFSSSIFEICSRNAKKPNAVVASVQHAEKTRFCTVFIINFWNLL